MCLHLNQDVITEIIYFLPLSDRLRCTRVSTTWQQAIQSLQNMWRETIDLLKIDQIYNHDDNKEPFGKDENEDQVDLMRIVKLQFLKLPKKIKVGCKDISDEDFTIKTLDQSHYGNVDLMKDWKSPFPTVTGLSYCKIDLQESVSYYEFPFDLRRDVIEKHTDEYAKSKIKSIYVMCLIYELMSLGDYVPNIYNDFVDIIAISHGSISFHNVALNLPFASLLLFIEFPKTFENWMTNEILKNIQPNHEVYEYTYSSGIYGIERSSTITVDMVIDSIHQEGLLGFDIRPRIQLKEDEHWLLSSEVCNIIKKLTVDDDFSGSIELDTDGLFPLYYNAGGGVLDTMTAQFSIDPERGIIKLIRKETRQYY